MSNVFTILSDGTWANEKAAVLHAKDEYTTNYLRDETTEQQFRDLAEAGQTASATGYGFDVNVYEDDDQWEVLRVAKEFGKVTVEYIRFAK